jgi:hypothetical protein
MCKNQRTLLREIQEKTEKIPNNNNNNDNKQFGLMVCRHLGFL